MRRPHIHVHVHTVPDELIDEMANVDGRLAALELKEAAMATRQEQLEASLAELDQATNEIAADLETLRGEVANGTVNAESLARLDANVQRLKALGQEPAPSA